MMRRAILVLVLAVAAPLADARAEAVDVSRVVTLPVADDATVSFRIWFKVGSQDDPPGKEGLSRLTALMLSDASTQAHSYERIQDLLFPMAASYDSTSGVEMTVIHGRTHQDNLEEYTRLFLDAIVRPALRSDDLERLRSEALSTLENTLRYASDEELGKAVLYNEIFAGTSYGHLTLGTTAGLRGITLEDVQAFYRERFTRENVVIGVGGGYPEALLERLRQELGALPPGDPATRPVPAPTVSDDVRVTIVEKDTGSTAISAGFPIDLVRGPREWYALALANSFLGEHRSSSSHLYHVIRELRGLNYGDYSYIEHLPLGGFVMKPQPNAGRRKQIFEIWIRPVPNGARHFALRAALRELARLTHHGLPRESFERTRSFLEKNVLQYATTTMERLAWALDDRFYGIPGSHLARFRKMMEAVTLDEVNAAVRKHLRVPGMHIVFVTPDAAALREALIANAPSPIEYESPKPEAVLAEDRWISVFPLRIRAENVKIVKVDELF
jgi:zinc protease